MRIILTLLTLLLFIGPNLAQYEFSHNKELCTSLNPNWEYNFHNDTLMKTFMSSKYSKDILDNLLPVEQADLWRYTIINEDGGMYLDSDVACMQHGAKCPAMRRKLRMEPF